MLCVILLSAACLVLANPINPDFLIEELTPEQVERLKNWTPDDKQNIWTLSGQFEGDIILNQRARNGLLDPFARWDNKELIYEFDSKISDEHRKLIIETLEIFSNTTCIKSRQKRITDSNWIQVTNKPEGCYSYVGKQMLGPQRLNLQENGCMHKSVILHEFMHALGFLHQQSSTERDYYLNIYWENIISSQKYNFDVYSMDYITNFGAVYDYASIMHYQEYDFSKNGQKTMEAKNGEKLGGRDDLSAVDIDKMNAMYRCGEFC